MKRALATNLGLAVLVAAAGAWLWLRPAAPTAEPDFPVSSLKAAEVKSLRLELSGAPPVVLERTARGWRQSAPVAARTDELRVERLLGLLSARSKTRLPARDLERFDLQSPVARLVADGQAFAFGAVNTITNEQYLLAGEHVFLVQPIHGYSLPPPGETLASKLLLGEDEVPAAFELPGRRIGKRDGKWQMDAPSVEAATLSQDDYLRWAERWRYASSLATVAAPPQPRGERIAIVLEDGRRIELLAREESGGFMLVRTDEKLEYRFAADLRARLLGGPAPEPR